MYNVTATSSWFMTENIAENSLQETTDGFREISPLTIISKRIYV